MWLASIHGGRSAMKWSPIKIIDKVKVPMLFLYSKMDTYAAPNESIQLFDVLVTDSYAQISVLTTLKNTTPQLKAS